jgi:hypothetical protein
MTKESKPRDEDTKKSKPRSLCNLEILAQRSGLLKEKRFLSPESRPNNNQNVVVPNKPKHETRRTRCGWSVMVCVVTETTAPGAPGAPLVM